jgi:hypothetical protein
MRTTGTGALPAAASAAQQRILELVEADSARAATAAATRQSGGFSGGARTASM